MANVSSSSSSGVSGLTLLTILFIGLKLTHYIDWPWKWVLAPVWAPVVIVAVILVLVCFLFLISPVRRAWRRRRSR